MGVSAAGQHGSENGIPPHDTARVKVMSAEPPMESPEEAAREPSVREIMALAERIRDLRVSEANLGQLTTCLD